MSDEVTTTKTEARGRTRIDHLEAEADRTRSVGDFLLNVARAQARSLPPEANREAFDRLTKVYRAAPSDWAAAGRPAEVRALAQSSGTTGGFTVPVDLTRAFLRSAAEQAIVRPRARVVRMEHDELLLPQIDGATARPAGTPSWFGGFAPAWQAEATNIPDQSPTLRQTRLVAHELVGSLDVSNALLGNAPTLLDDLILPLFGEAVAYLEDTALLFGNGIGRPTGIHTSPVTLTTAARGNASAITAADARALLSRLLPSSRSRAVYLVSQAAEDELLNATGTASNVFSNADQFLDPTTGRVRTFLHKCEVVTTEKGPALNVAGDFGLYDFSRYVVGDRLSMEVAASEHVNYRNAQTTFRVVHRIGGMPFDAAPFTLPDGATTASPFVRLGTA